MAYAIDRLQSVRLGRCGENKARRVAIDASAWLGRWPGATFEVVCQRPTESTLYVPDTQLQDTILIWTVTAADTAIPGMGKAEVRALLDDVVVKSAVFTTEIEATLEGTQGETPEASADWVNKVISAAADAVEASEQAAESADRAEENVRTALAEAKASGEFKGDKGDTGLGIESIEQVRYTTTDEGINTWKATLTDGTYSLFNVHNGSKGSQGERGERGEPGKDGAPGVPGQDGAPGSSGVHIGAQAPTGDENVWIDPEGQGTNALPNPYPLTINGASYDGSEAVNIDIAAGGSDNKWASFYTNANIGGTNRAEYKTDQSGRSFAFSAAMVEISVPAASSASWVDIAFWNDGGTSTTLTIKPGINTTASLYRVYCYVDHGRTKIWCPSPVGSAGDVPAGIMLPGFNNEFVSANTITRVIVNGRSFFPANTYCTVWGVNA